MYAQQENMVTQKHALRCAAAQCPHFLAFQMTIHKDNIEPHRKLKGKFKHWSCIFEPNMFPETHDLNLLSATFAQNWIMMLVLGSARGGNVKSPPF